MCIAVKGPGGGLKMQSEEEHGGLGWIHTGKCHWVQRQKGPVPLAAVTVRVLVRRSAEGVVSNSR